MLGELDITQGDGAALAVPSGQLVQLLDIIWNSEGPDGPTPRFRFVAPAIARMGGSVGFETVEADLQYLCETFGLEQLSQRGLMPALVLMSISDRAVAFGESNPDVTQYFDAFTIEGQSCIREYF